TRSSLDSGEVGHRIGGVTDLIEQLEAILALVRHFDIDRDLVEERIDRWPQLGDRRHGGGEILTRRRLLDRLTGGADAFGELLLFRLCIELLIRRARIGSAILLFL